MDWEYQLARRLKQDGGRKPEPPGVEGRVESASPLTISLYGGEVMAPPAPLAVVESAPGYTVSSHAIQKLPWQAGDRVVCCWMGKTLVVLGRLS
ncbi:hypothetical protein [Muriventricola aceti]|uniref:hypothetical protein n=1 Tax=Muriventricola aceti TaxID=2981773 RepID=UPI003EBD63B8